jgi:hypothetical protein
MSATPQTKQVKRCDHPSFKVVGNIFRLTDTDDGPVTGFTAEITINCIECSMPFEWQGVDRGLSVSKPMKSADGLTLRAPIIPLAEL